MLSKATSMDIQSVVEKVGEVIIAHQMRRPLSNFSSEELNFFPINYLTQYTTTIELNNVFEKLPKKFKDNKYLKLKLPCIEHYNRLDIETHNDGPPPMKMHCPLCLNK